MAFFKQFAIGTINNLFLWVCTLLAGIAAHNLYVFVKPTFSINNYWQYVYENNEHYAHYLRKQNLVPNAQYNQTNPNNQINENNTSPIQLEMVVSGETTINIEELPFSEQELTQRRLQHWYALQKNAKLEAMSKLRISLVLLLVVVGCWRVYLSSKKNNPRQT